MSIVLLMLHKRQNDFSYREVGIKYLEIMKNKGFKTNEELASYLNIGIESIRKRIQAAKISKELIRIFPDSEGYLILIIVNWLELKKPLMLITFL